MTGGAPRERPGRQGTSGPFGRAGCAEWPKTRSRTPFEGLGFALVDQGSRTAAKVVVGIFGGLYLLAGLGLTAFSAFLALAAGSTGGATATKTVLYAAAALAIWV